MGQYQQWLHYRRVDQQLHTLKEDLITKIARIQEHITFLDAPPLDADNSIIQALTWYVQAPSTSLQELTMEQPSENGHIPQPETISQALFDHSRLPNLEPIHLQDTHELPLSKRSYAPLPPIPHKATDVIPEDAATFPSESAQIEPQIELPWWLRNAALSATQGNTLDQQSVRTNRLVQRWLERWGRQEAQASHSLQAETQRADSQQEGTKS